MKKGMNPEAVDQMATQITDAADQANEVYQRVLARVQEFDWTGEDRDRYVSEFESTVGQAVQQLVQQAQDLSERASKNASEQRDASA